MNMNSPSIRTHNSPALRVPGYLSVRAAAELLGIRERSVRELVERRRLASARLGRLHFLPSAVVEAYRGERRQRARRRAGRRAPHTRAA
jgi:excisionase family DNA binding protein